MSSGLRLNETHLDELNLLKGWTSCLGCFSLRQSVSFPLCLLYMPSGHRGWWYWRRSQVLPARGRTFPFHGGFRVFPSWLLLTRLQLQWPGICFCWPGHGWTPAPEEFSHLCLLLGRSPSRPCPLRCGLGSHPNASLYNIPPGKVGKTQDVICPTAHFQGGSSEKHFPDQDLKKKQTTNPRASVCPVTFEDLLNPPTLTSHRSQMLDPSRSPHGLYEGVNS